MNMSPSKYNPDEQLILEGNIARLIASADQPSAARVDWLLQPVLAEVGRRRRKLRRRRILTGVVASIAAAAATLAITVLALRNPASPERSPSIAESGVSPAVTEVARVKDVSGLASLTDGGTPRALAGREIVAPGQWLTTAWGSRAELLLADQSQLVVQPHTRLQINSRASGENILLEEGQIGLKVVKQPPGKALTISAPESQITVVGTALDVQVLTKSNGRKQTWVNVRSGRVEFVSGGQRVVLLPNMQGVANEGEPPLVRSQTAELNELAQLVERTTALAAKAGIPPGRAAIVEFNSDGSATVWSLIELRNAAGADMIESFLAGDTADDRLDVFSLQGARFPVVRQGKQWRIDWSADPLPPGGRRTAVVRVGNVRGLLTAVGRGVFQFAGPAAQPAQLSLLQIRLPSSASVEEIEPKPVEVRRSFSRLVVTIASGYQLPHVVGEPPH